MSTSEIKNKYSYSIAVVGNPNCGKTTVFNGLTGSSQRIGNWPGVTVEKKAGSLIGAADIEIVDLPGIYSLNADSNDELIARNYILSNNTDLIVNIADTSNLERSLYLTVNLLEMGKPTLLVLNMKDLAERNGIATDFDELSRALGIPIMAVNALNGADIRDVRRAIKDQLKNLKAAVSGIEYPQCIESVLREWQPILTGCSRLKAVMMLEEDDEITASAVASGLVSAEAVQAAIESVTAKTGDTPDIVVAEARFSYISSILSRVLKKKTNMASISASIDRIALNRWTGIPVFMGVMYLVFWMVTSVGGAFIDFFDILFGAVFVDGLGAALEAANLPKWVITLFAGGVGAGIQTVSTFIPVVFSMFFALSILEDSGYMARAAFVMDRMMHKIGLPGKAFVPLLVGFGCTVPAVMATRTLENKRDRYLTIFMVPFMSCGARLPVYALFGAAFFGIHSGLMIYCLYLFGFLLAILTGLLLKNTLFQGASSHFIMELPPYHLPRWGVTLTRTWNRVKVFIFGAGKIIIVAVLILAFFNSIGMDGSIGREYGKNSLLAAASRTVTPVFSPMGIEEENWPAAVALVTGLFSKEAIIGTITGLYGQMAAAEAGESGSEAAAFSLGAAFKNALLSIPRNLKKVASGLFKVPASQKDAGREGLSEKDDKLTIFGQLRLNFGNDWTRAFAYLLFILIYFPCVSAFGAIVREIGPGYGWLAMIYLTILAWSVATLFFQMASGHSMFWIITAILAVGIFIPVFNIISGRWLNRFWYKKSMRTNRRSVGEG
ncbi:MAG: ferrous iron transport protein B [Spirochaeta sp. LUC14_002_19_P3]|nr:MAG: ferrous iron transport protein B [Spirochaeta sp. LUC14_002_19_P3]